MILRPRLIVQATTVIWVLFMGGALYASAIWTSYENFSVASDHDRGNGVQSGLDGVAIESPASLSGGQEPPSLPGNPVPLTSGKGGANPPAPASVRSASAFKQLTVAWGEGSGPSAQGEREKPEAGSDRSAGYSASAVVQLPLRDNRRKHTETRVPPRPVLRTMATNAAHLCGVPVSLFHALIARESSWNPRARSSSGALGLGQLMPAAAREMGVEDRLDPWQNLVGSACYLRAQFKGSWRKALLSYHAGASRRVTRKASHEYAADIMEGSAQ